LLGVSGALTGGGCRSALAAISLAGLVSIYLLIPGRLAVSQQAQQPAVPDAPSPQPHTPLSNTEGPITPGKGAGEKPASSANSSSSDQVQPPPSLPQAPIVRTDEGQPTAPEMPMGGEGVEKTTTLIRLNVNFVEVPVTVKDGKGKLVPGLTYRDFKVFENGGRVPLALFTVDPFPLSIVFVVDQSLTSDIMTKVNDSLGAIQGALTPYDELAVFTYSNGSQNRSGGFTGAQSSRVPFVLSMTKAAGEEVLIPVNSGPLAGCNIRVNSNCADPNIQPGRSVGSGSGVITIPKEIHTLNDAILAAAHELSSRPKGRRRIIYVISDGKEYGSKATYKEVLHYLEQYQIAVYGTAVGDSARWGEGYISRLHLPFTMYDNRLASYVIATGGTLDSELSLNGIEKSYAKIAEEARNQYTLGYYTHQPAIDGKFRKIEVLVERPGMEVISKTGYYPMAQDLK
jgi:VWFA-related protein